LYEGTNGEQLLQWPEDHVAVARNLEVEREVLGQIRLHMMGDAMGKLTSLFTSADPSLTVKRVGLGLRWGPPGVKYRVILA
jgi:hypothetical protein